MLLYKRSLNVRKINKNNPKITRSSFYPDDEFSSSSSISEVSSVDEAEIYGEVKKVQKKDKIDSEEVPSES
jgi:hypothetical protein